MDDKSNNSISDVDEESSDSSNESSEDGSNSEEEDVEDNDEEDDCVAAGGDSFVNNDDEDEENTPLGLDSIVKVTNTLVAMRKSSGKSSVKVVPVERGIHRIISFILFHFFILQPTLVVLIVKSPIPTRKVSKGDQLLAALATANKVREAPTPLYIKKQTEAILLCKEMKVFNALTSKERNAVSKTFIDDATGGTANWFLLMDEADRIEYIDGIVSNIGYID